MEHGSRVETIRTKTEEERKRGHQEEGLVNRYWQLVAAGMQVTLLR
jgi:hypothetical protein